MCRWLHHKPGVVKEILTVSSSGNMKSILVSSLLLASASATAVSRKVSYDGARVVRLAVGEEVEKVSSLIEGLQLSSWSGRPEKDALIDLVVPASKVEEFDMATANMEAELMHENLGASIAEESSFARYAGELLKTYDTEVESDLRSR